MYPSLLESKYQYEICKKIKKLLDKPKVSAIKIHKDEIWLREFFDKNFKVRSNWTNRIKKW